MSRATQLLAALPPLVTQDPAYPSIWRNLEDHKSIPISEVDLLSLFGRNDRNLALIEKSYGISLVARGEKLLLNGPSDAIREATRLLTHLIATVRREPEISEDELRTLIQQDHAAVDYTKLSGQEGLVKTYKPIVKVRTEGQADYVHAMSVNDIVFAIGPAGTGKTYLAVAAAVAALRLKQVSRIVLARPAVEAGESLGFLPGALEDKVDPYLRPLYDALQDMVEPDRLRRFQEVKIVEVAPLAYMRGRTLNDAFIILDEAQNTTPQQMKMFLTRLGSQSKAIVTGDITQIDLRDDQPSGLVEVQRFLRDIEGVHFAYLTERDVIRNPLVQEVIKAYERYEQTSSPGSPDGSEP